MTSSQYHELLLNEYENRELSKEDLSDTLKYYAKLFLEENRNE